MMVKFYVIPFTRFRRTDAQTLDNDDSIKVDDFGKGVNAIFFEELEAAEDDANNNNDVQVIISKEKVTVGATDEKNETPSAANFKKVINDCKEKFKIPWKKVRPTDGGTHPLI